MVDDRVGDGERDGEDDGLRGGEGNRERERDFRTPLLPRPASRLYGVMEAWRGRRR